MSDYAFVPGGSLKFKGGAEKKKKKKSHSSTDRSKLDSEIKHKDGGSSKGKERDLLRSEEAYRDRSGSTSRSPMPERKEEGPKMTEAERRFLEQQKKRRQERVKQTAKMTHKERVSEFNAKLDSLSEHHDMPRIGPG
ncbi:hypothetical protein IAR50_004086 [Cryptococcus sp. DSM 104548]